MAPSGAEPSNPTPSKSAAPTNSEARRCSQQAACALDAGPRASGPAGDEATHPWREGHLARHVLSLGSWLCKAPAVPGPQWHEGRKGNGALGPPGKSTSRGACGPQTVEGRAKRGHGAAERGDFT